METIESNEKKCSYCGEVIAANLGRCPYCGSLLEVQKIENKFERPIDNKFVRPVENIYERPMQTIKPKMFGNGLKVFLTTLFVIVPGIGQIAGVITAIILMSSDIDKDKQSFGLALLIASLIVFVLVCTITFSLALTIPMLGLFQ